MIADITRGIRADDVRSRLAGAGGRDHARDQMIRSRCPLGGVSARVRTSPVMGGAAGWRPQPLGDLERDADLEAVAGQREREQPLGALGG
jgi:hypothetical protein